MDDLKFESISVKNRSEKKHEELGLDISKGKNYIYFKSGKYGSSISFKDAEKLWDWLTEALKPRYTVEEKVQMGEVGQWEVIDNDCPGYKYPVELVTFKERSGYDAKAEACKLCKRLNEGEP